MKVSDTQQIERIREALQGPVTPGAWFHESLENGRDTIAIFGKEGMYQVADVIDYNRYPENAANAKFIAACNPDAIRALLARLEECERDAKRYRALKANADTVFFDESVTFIPVGRDRPIHVKQIGGHELDIALDSAIDASQEQSHG